MNNLNAIPWYSSPVQIAQVTTAVSAVIALFPKVGQLLGWTSPSDVSTGITTIFGFIAVVAPLVGSFARARSKIQPLTLTQAGADVHPQTLANDVKAANVVRAAQAAATVQPIPTPKVTP